MKPLYNSEQYNILWGSSWIALFPTITAIKNKKYDLALCTGGVWISSLLYWKYPINNWKRMLDLILVRCCFSYQLLKSFELNKHHIFIPISMIGIGNYYVGCNFYNGGNRWISVYCHLGLHIFANIGNFILVW